MGVEVAIPQSQDAALRDAVAAVRAIAPTLAALAGGGSLAASGKRIARAKKGGGAKGFGGGGDSGGASSSASASSGYSRYAIELPVADTSAAASAALADSLLARLAPAGGAVVVFADEAAAAASASSAANPLRRAALSLRAACRAPSLPSATLLIIVAPAVADVALVEQLIEEVWAPGAGSSSSSSSSSSLPPVLVVNPGWAERGGPAVPREFERLVDSFNVAYSFCPVAISGLVRGKQGAVLLDRGRGSGSGSGSAGDKACWRILCESNVEGRFVQIGQARVRPSDDDIQAAFLNASAAASPLTKAVKAARGMFGGGKEGGGGGDGGEKK